MSLVYSIERLEQGFIVTDHDNGKVYACGKMQAYGYDTTTVFNLIERLEEAYKSLQEMPKQSDIPMQ